MSGWESCSEIVAASEWDESLALADDHAVFQSYGWGEYKRAAGWEPLRYWYRDKDGRVQGMAQFLLKRLPLGIGLLWAAGGPALVFPNKNQNKASELLRELLELLDKRYPRALIRFQSHSPHDSALVYDISKVCHRPAARLNSGFSIRMELDSLDEAAFRKQMTSKHRYYTKKAAEAGICWSVGNGDQQLRELAALHREMVDAKQLESIATSYEELERMRNALGDHVLIVNGCLNDTPVTSCLVLLFGKKAFYMVASTGEKGRDVSAAYAMVEQLIQQLRERGISRFDFGGIDPVNKSASGVNHFKCGFGGQITEYVGEWESASSGLIQSALNFAIRKRGGRV